MAIDVQRSLDFGNVRRLLNVPDATTDQEPATLAQLKKAIEGLAQKDDVRVASVGNVNIASPGSALDGVTLSSADRALLKNQSVTSENGLYIWNGASTPMTRSLDANTFDELEGALVPVVEGTVNAGTVWRQTAINGTLGTNPVLWVIFGTVNVQATESTLGIVRIATQIQTDAGTDDQTAVTPLKLKSSLYSARKVAANFGDGSALLYLVTHNLNTFDVLVEVVRNSGNRDTVMAEVRRSGVNSVSIAVDTAPTTDQLRVLIWG